MNLSRKKGTLTNRTENCSVIKIYSSKPMRTSRFSTNFCVYSTSYIIARYDGEIGSSILAAMRRHVTERVTKQGAFSL